MKKTPNDIDPLSPFYSSNLKYKTSTEIISEARAVIRRDKMANSDFNILGGGSGVPRPLGTQRPFTPRERQRTLFGKIGRTSRPPSAVNLKYLQNQTTDVIKNSYGNRKGQFTSMKNLNLSLDESSFNNLENIDENPELPMLRKKRCDSMRKSKSMNMETEEEVDSHLNNNLKLKLPSLNCLPKPLHNRKGMNQRSSLLQSLSEEKEEINNFQGVPSSQLILSKSTDHILFSDGVAEKEKKINHSLHLENIPSLEIFNKRRLFGDSKSKSEDLPTYLEDSIHIEKLSILNDYDINDESTEFPENYISQQSSLKIAVQIPTPKLESNNEITLLEKTSGNKHIEKTPTYYEILDNLSNKDSKFLLEDDITEMLSILYDTIEKEMSWHNISGEEKALILKVLYKYIESSNERLLIAMARIILALRVTGSNLSGVCKLIFKIARNDRNDHLFLNDNLMELFIIGLGRAEPLHDAECLVYGYGALKFLGMNPILLERLRPLGVLPLMTLHLKMFNEARMENPHSVGEQGCHGLYQLTGALRNMAGNDGLWNNGLSNDKFSSSSTPCNNLLDFVTEGTLTEICRTTHLFIDDLDIEINVSRTLSVLSADFECCISLCEQKNILRSIVKLLESYTDKAPLVVRLTYILGNMVACNNDMRLELYNESNALNILIKILNVYLKQSWSNSKVDSAENIIIGSDLDGSNGSNEDVMVKTVRVIANMCMNPNVGEDIIQERNIDNNIFVWMLKCLRQYGPLEHIELTVSVLAALNNLSYYYSGEQNISCAFAELQIQFCEALGRLLTQEETLCTTEAMRVLGNLSRSKITIDFIVDTGALPDIIKLTTSDNSETSLAAAGVLINLAADKNARNAWLNINGINEAINAIQLASANHHWQVAQLLCQALWNASPLPSNEISLLAPLLLDILDEQQVFGDIGQIESSCTDVFLNDGKIPLKDNYLSIRLAWEDFAAVAVNLLEKIDPLIHYDDDIYSDKSDAQSNLIPM